MKELEILLNSLIQMGWKPWKILVDKIIYINSKFMLVCLDTVGGPKRQIKQDSLRELVSLESGLWHFVCENKLYKEHNGKIERYFDFNEDDYLFHYARDFRYRLLESALIPEEELEKFLVDNIKIEG